MKKFVQIPGKLSRLTCLLCGIIALLFALYGNLNAATFAGDDDGEESSEYITSFHSSNDAGCRYHVPTAHPPRHHHIVRRRSNEHFFVGEKSGGETASGEIPAYPADRKQVLARNSEVRPSYYTFLFRYAVF